jgi:flagellar hook-basal body protein
MASEVSTIQSLKAVDAWIDVINANINGGVRTAFKASRLKFSGSNVDISRTGNATSLPLQFPEAGLTTANTVIDFTQGAVTASTENTHLALQGDGFFMVVPPSNITAAGSFVGGVPFSWLLTRDGEFRTNQQGYLVNSYGYYLVTYGPNGGGNPDGPRMRAVYNDLDGSPTSATATSAVKLSDFITNNFTAGTVLADGVATLGVTTVTSFVKLSNGKQTLKYSQFGSTSFEAWTSNGAWFSTVSATGGTSSDATILSKSLEASNASMTQSVPELSLAQKLFSALTKVLQTKQTNVDGVLNLVR